MFAVNIVGVLLTHHQPQCPGDLGGPALLLGCNGGNRGLQTTQQQIQHLSYPTAWKAVRAAVHY
jgi:hypothetical protein